MKNLHDTQTMDLFDEQLNPCLCNEITQVLEEQQKEGERNEPVMTYVNGEWVDARTLTM